MNARTLLDNFDLIADAPGGVPKLRKLILQLAVRSKLVPQDPTEAPVRLFDGDIHSGVTNKAEGSNA